MAIMCNNYNNAQEKRRDLMDIYILHTFDFRYFSFRNHYNGSFSLRKSFLEIIAATIPKLVSRYRSCTSLMSRAIKTRYTKTMIIAHFSPNLLIIFLATVYSLVICDCVNHRYQK